MISHKVGEGLFLVRHTVGKAAPAKPVEHPTNHVVVVDCSGSMWSELPRIREQLKLKLPKLLGDQDTVSIVWFSSRGEFGTLLEGERVSTLKDLSDVNKAIDRWLRPVALTGFKEPLEEAARLADRVAKKNPGVFSLFFQSDGYENQWPQKDVLAAVEAAVGKFSAITIVEYGYYCNRQLMAAMAEKAGGALIFSEDFDRYEPAFEACMQKRVSGAPRVEVALPSEPVKGFAFAMKDGDLLTFGCEDGKVQVPEDLGELWWLSEREVGEAGPDLAASAEAMVQASLGRDALAPGALREVSAAYAALALYGQRMQSGTVLSILRALGDVRLIDLFSGCFGKQKYADFCDLAKAASADAAPLKARDPGRVPRDDAFTVLDLLRILSEDDGSRVLLDHPEFKYSRIGRGRVDSSDLLTREEQAEVAELTARIAATRKAAEIRQHQARIDEILAGKREALKFVARPAPDGYPISALKFNEERPNVSFLVRREGTVDVSSRIPAELRGKVPDVVDTFTWRNYAVVADGLVNIEKLPLHITEATWARLRDAGAFGPGYASEWIPNTTFNLRGYPVINRRMVKEVSAKALFEQEYRLTEARAAQKVYNAYVKDKLPPRKVEGLAAKYGDAAAAWLREQGITDGGFSPKMVQAEAKDFYLGKELAVSIKGYSKLPSLKELAEMVRKKKVNAPGALMRTYADAVEAFLNSPAYAGAPDKDEALKAWLSAEAMGATERVRGLLFDKAQQVFSVIVGQVWPVEWASLDENTLSVTVDGVQVDGKAELREIEIKV